MRANLTALVRLHIHLLGLLLAFAVTLPAERITANR